MVPPNVLKAHLGRCLNCDLSVGRNFVFVETEAECPVCLETAPGNVALHGCSHNVCVGFLKSMTSDCVVRCPLCRKLSKSVFLGTVVPVQNSVVPIAYIVRSGATLARR